MSSKTLAVPHFDAQSLVTKATKHCLRQGEAHALSIHITGLERALLHKRDAQTAEARRHEVRVCLDEAGGALVVTFPGEACEHSVGLPLGQGPIALDYLVKLLRERRGQTSLIGTPGAPTKADLAALAAASKKQPTRCDRTLTLEDLDL